MWVFCSFVRVSSCWVRLRSSPGTVRSRTVRARKVGHEFLHPFVSKRNKSDLWRLCSRAWRAFPVHWHTWRTLPKGVGLVPGSRLARSPPQTRTTTRFYHTRGAIINRLTVIDKKAGLSNEVTDDRGDSCERTGFRRRFREFEMTLRTRGIKIEQGNDENGLFRHWFTQNPSIHGLHWCQYDSIRERWKCQNKSRFFLFCKFFHFTTVLSRFFFVLFFSTFEHLYGEIIRRYFICADRGDIEVCASVCFVWIGPGITAILALKRGKSHLKQF